MFAKDSGLLQGTVELLILKTLSWGPMHGYGIASWIESATEDATAGSDYLCDVVLPDPVGTRGAPHREERPCGTQVQVKGRGPASHRAGPRPLTEPRYERRFFDLGLFRPDAGRRGAPG